MQTEWKIESKYKKQLSRRRRPSSQSVTWTLVAQAAAYVKGVPIILHIELTQYPGHFS
jgi:hypothetical protein